MGITLKEAIISTENNKDIPLTYSAAGVNIDEGDALIDDIGADTRRTARPGADAALGGFGAMFDLKAAGFNDPVLVAATDGVGTKLEIARASGHHRGLGIDLVAMCVNDVLAQGAMPLFFLDYYATGRLDRRIAADVVAGIADGCVLAGCALIGGETAEMPGVYPDGGYDLAGFCVGAMERGQMIDPSRTRAGDIAIAIASSGAHANGFSLIRKIVERTGLDWNDPAPFTQDDTLGKALLEPTAIYVTAIRDVITELGGVDHIHGLAHITGGGLIENPPRAFREELTLELDLSTWDMPSVFRWLMTEGAVPAMEMARVFNTGIGMLIYVEENDADKAMNAIRANGHDTWIAGRLVNKTDDERVLLNGLESWS